jgi:hypothetical protein
VYKTELLGTRFIGVGNPAESGAHLLYYFRQVNRLPKKLFVDITGAFSQRIMEQRNTSSASSSVRLGYFPAEQGVSRYVFFDDLVGSGTQASSYLEKNLRKIRQTNKDINISFISLFATTKGLAKLNEPSLFDGKAMCLFELDETYKAFETTSRYFSNPPAWFDSIELRNIAEGYGKKLNSSDPLGYKDGQLLLSFTHNTPDNAPSIFWDEGYQIPWSPVFIRYDKIYGSNP